MCSPTTSPYGEGLTKKKELFTSTPSTDTCRGGKNQLFDLFSQPQLRYYRLFSQPHLRYYRLFSQLFLPR